MLYQLNPFVRGIMSAINIIELERDYGKHNGLSGYEVGYIDGVHDQLIAILDSLKVKHGYTMYRR